MRQARFTLKELPDATLRRLRSTPSYFFLIWRWSMWIYALIVITGSGPSYRNTPVFYTCILLLIITFLQSLVMTLYSPVIQVFLAHFTPFRFLKHIKRSFHGLEEEDEDTDILTPLAATHNRYWEISIYALDVIICGLVTYYSGPFGKLPNFGSSSPFYRYGMSTAFAAALPYRYRGSLIAAIGYDLFILAGMFFPPSGPAYTPNIIDIAGSLVDTPIAALLVAFVISLLARYIHSNKQLQDDVRRQTALLGVAETIVREANNQELLLQKSAEQLQHGGHFERLIIALTDQSATEGKDKDTLTIIETQTEARSAGSASQSGPWNQARLAQVAQEGQKIQHFERDRQSGIASLYLPFSKEGKVQMIIGAEKRQPMTFESKQEDFLHIAGAQILIALDNMRLAEQTIQLAASAERSRIAREIHDGIAQLIFMLSLNTETCATQARRLIEASEEDAELLTPLAQRLNTLVTISKQALWETRNYMFSLRPLMKGTTTLTQMLTSQLREFEAISDLPVKLIVEGKEQPVMPESQLAYRRAQVGAAIFRIVQEALTNAYKHAAATHIEVFLHYRTDGIEVEISDNGHGLPPTLQADGQTNEQAHIYSGQGLDGMRDRASELGGNLEITPASAVGGVKVRAWMPV
ncbi:hypothetical protein EPA93_21990 [Ktedonosporobacter rubrisoli]|uniref:histidine kinase n=1 Tax=Ktedonosporobacter rubrisoli TaxID=2509675 RepID=A0A4P6JSJ1_KTERU|nr:ATP-binding protein [Ktedonosporobacter rubrisoli]QBD78518.1 hypothetical protein EPA93_21990 [Ktedonosporobacter rubrisoli]